MESSRNVVVAAVLLLQVVVAQSEPFVHGPAAAAAGQKGHHGGAKRADDETTPRCRPCTCGVGYSGSRIVGGTEARENEYPWMASLWNARRKFFCGGSIVTDRYVLTAAHCFSENPSPDYRDVYVALGLSKRPDRLQFPGSAHVIRAVAIKLHNEYHPEAVSYVHDNDIALVKLSRPAKFERHTQPICLPAIRRDYGGTIGSVAGWGQLSEIGGTSLSLRHATVPVWSQYECARVPELAKTGYTSNMLCAGLRGGGLDSCQGDSGGPLMIFDDNEKIAVAGIVSWGVGCGAPGLPGVYTRVDKYLRWIARHTRDSCHCTN